MPNQQNKTRDMLGRKGLTHVDEALQILLNSLGKTTVQSEILALDDCLDRITAEPIISPEDLPAHTRSTMDGYAVCAADTFGASQTMPCYLQIAGEVLMGENPKETLRRGSCFRISTGGLLPPGSDGVVMLEHTVPVDSTMIEIIKSVGTGTNLIDRGEDICKGAPALPSGYLLRPQDLGLLAGIGVAKLQVYRRPRIGILATGDEIVPYSEPPAPGKVRNINSIALAAQVMRAGGQVTDYGIVTDKEEYFYPVITTAVKENDIVLFSGGSSVGMRDLGEKMIESLGDPGILVHGVALKPGKPIIIGLTGSTPVFGLPGHPVSAMVCFDFFVKPAIKKISGLHSGDGSPSLSISARLARNINSAAGRRDLVRVQLTEKDAAWVAQPVLGKSGSISTLSRAHGYFLIDESSQGVTEDTEVEVFLYT